MFTLLEVIEPEYHKSFIYTYKRGSKFMYAESNKGVYVTLEASLLFWGDFQKACKKWDIR